MKFNWNKEVHLDSKIDGITMELILFSLSQDLQSHNPETKDDKNIFKLNIIIIF